MSKSTDKKVMFTWINSQLTLNNKVNILKTYKKLQ